MTGRVAVLGLLTLLIPSGFSSEIAPHGSGGSDPHFSIMLPDRMHLCYSIQGKPNTAFNLISSSNFFINALFVPDSKRDNITWMGSIGVVFTRPLQFGGFEITHFKIDATTQAVHVGDKITLSAQAIKEISSRDGSISIVEVTKHTASHRCSTVAFYLSDMGLYFTVKFKNEHLDIFWLSPVDGGHSHGLIGQFWRNGVVVDEARKLLFLPNNAPVPVKWKPVWKYMEHSVDELDAQHCWAAMNRGQQGDGLIEGNYMDYAVEHVLSSDFYFHASMP